MNNIYKEIDDYIVLLEKNAKNKFASKIRDAKLGGTMAGEILGMVAVELKKYPNYLRDRDEALIQVAVILLDKINAWLKLYRMSNYGKPIRDWNTD